MKKWLLGLTMALVLTGCGAKNDEEDTVPQSENNGQIILNNGETGDSNIPEREPVPYRFESHAVRFEIQSVNPDAAEGYEMKLLFENKLEGVELNFALEEFAVQRWISDTYADYIFEQQLGNETGVVTVAPMSTKEMTVYLDWNALSEMGITTVDEIRFNLRAWNWDYNNLASVAYDEAAVYPTGLDADSIVVPVKQRTEEMKTVLDNNCISMVLTEFVVNEDGRMQARYLVENKLDEKLYIEVLGGNRMLNGEAYDSPWLYGFYLSGNMHCFVDIYLYHEEAENLSQIVLPEEINSFEATVMLYYYDEALNYHTEELRLVY